MTARKFRYGLVGIGFLIAAAILTPSAQATSFAPLTIEQFTDASTYIVEGKVSEVWTELDPVHSVVWTRARVEITTTLKGPDSPTTLIVNSLGGVFGDFDFYVPGMAVFSVDEDVLLFLDTLSDGRLVPVSKFLGKYTIRRATGERAPYARTWHTSHGETFDARFLPHPDAKDRIYLEGLREQIQNRLELGWDGQPISGISNERLLQINPKLSTPRTP